MTDESERWLKGLARQSSVKNRWPHGHEKPGEPSKPPSGIRRSSGSDSQDGCSSERSHRHAKGRTGEISGRVRAGSETAVPAQVETTQSSTRPRTTPHVQQIPQPTPLLLAPILPTETQPSTTWPFIGAKYSTTQPSVRVGYIQPSKQSPVVLKSKSYSCEVCNFPVSVLCFLYACMANAEVFVYSNNTATTTRAHGCVMAFPLINLLAVSRPYILHAITMFPLLVLCKS